MSKLKNYNKTKLLLAFLVFAVGLVCGRVFINVLNKEVSDIETSIVKYTVDDKVYGMPYINPAWEEYMNLSDEDKEQITNVPSMYVYDYIPENNIFGNYDNIPSEFNLRDDYPTTLYNQGNEGLCWAYATATMLESNLKVTRGIDEQFSVNYLNYLTASSSLYTNNYNPYSLSRKLGKGLANSDVSAYMNVLFSSGVVAMKNDKFNLQDTNNFDISNIVDYDNFDYSVTNTVSFPRYQNTVEYRNMLKSFIMKYGAVYIGGSILGTNGHAVVIVGWDDDGVVTSNGLKYPQGAWIIQNSWDELTFDTYLIPYDTSDIDEIFGVKSIIDKNWDNLYNYTSYPNISFQGVDIYQSDNERGFELGTSLSSELYKRLHDYTAITGTLYTTYNKASFKNEKLDMVSIISGSQNSNYDIYVSVDGDKDNYDYVKHIETDLPGIYTVSFDDVVLENEKFSIKVVTEDGALYTQTAVYTSDIEESIVPIENNVISYIDAGGENYNGNYEYHVVTYTNNISNGEKISYVLRDKDMNVISNSIEDSYVYSGKTIGVIELSKKTKLNTKMYVDIIYNDQLINTIDFEYYPDVYLAGMLGSGTESDPYKVTNAQQLACISNSPSAYYILENDIDLSYDTNVFVTYNKTKGWIPLKTFSGTLDGKGHSITNLYINNTDPVKVYNKDNVGLFSVIEEATIKNLRIENARVINSSYFDDINHYNGTGILAGSTINSNIHDILLTGDVEAVTSVGLLSGSMRIDSNSNSLDKIVAIGNVKFNSDEKIQNKYLYVGGLSGKIDGAQVQVNNSIFMEKVNAVDNHDLYIGGFCGNCSVKMQNSYIFTDVFDNVGNTIGKIKGSGYMELQENVNTYNGVFKSYSEIEQALERNVRTYDSIDDFKNMDLSLLGFDSDIWEYLDSNPYPTLKSLPFYFVNDISVDDTINVSLNNNKAIDATVTPVDASYKDLMYTVSDSGIAKVKDGRVYGVNTGDTTLVVSSLDGSNISKTINIHVYDGEYTLSYKYSDDVVVSSKYDEGMIINLSDNDALQNTLRYLYGWEYNGVIYRTGEAFSMPGGDTVLEAVYRLEPPVISKYEYSNKDNLIKNICYTSIENYKNNLNVDSNYTVKIFNRNNQEVIDGNIGTGYITKIYLGNEEVIDYVNVVPGDLDGDARIRSRDVTYALQYIVGVRQPHERDFSYMALDFSRDGEFRLNDARLIQAYVVQDYTFFNEVCPNE